MAYDSGIEDLEPRILGVLNEKLGMQAKDVQSALHKAGRRLPKDAHRAGQELQRAIMQAGHPRLSRQLDTARVAKAETRLMYHLDKIDPKKRRTDAMLSMLGTQVFNLLVIAAVLIAVLVWRGFL